MSLLRRLLPGFLPAAVALTLTAPASAQGMMEMPPQPLPAGTVAPAFQTTTLSGKPLSLASLRGKVVLIDYWATWCGPCRMATPTLNALQARFGKKGFTVVGMSMDRADSIAQVRPFVKAMHVAYPVTVSLPGNARAQRAYNARALPSQYLIDRRGIVRWSQSGYSLDEGRQLPVLVHRLLAEKRR